MKSAPTGDVGFRLQSVDTVGATCGRPQVHCSKFCHSERAGGESKNLCLSPRDPSTPLRSAQDDIYPRRGWHFRRKCPARAGRPQGIGMIMIAGGNHTNKIPCPRPTITGGALTGGTYAAPTKKLFNNLPIDLFASAEGAVGVLFSRHRT